MKIDPLRSWLGARLVQRHYWRQSTGLRCRLWNRLWREYARGTLPVELFLHGRRLRLNPGSLYPLLVAEHPHFNAGLVAAAKAVQKQVDRPVHLIDVGAAVGDSAVLVHEHLGRNLGSCICVDGAEDNRPLLEHNLEGIPGAAILITMLSSEPGPIPSLLRHKPGTAAAIGPGRTTACTLDQALSCLPHRNRCDLLKIDTDGYDGDVVAGAVRLLETDRPVVCFEWHPDLIARCGRAAATAFDVLRGAGYGPFIWLHNTGPLSHWSNVPPQAEYLEQLARYLRFRNTPFDPHYDVIALPEEKAPWLEHILQIVPFP